VLIVLVSNIIHILIDLLIRFTGETSPEIISRLKRDLIPTIKSGLIYWPLCDFITFKFVPVHLQVIEFLIYSVDSKPEFVLWQFLSEDFFYQPLVSNSFSFLWTIYITYMASLKKADVEVATAS
jgi:protein Mpv17